MNVPTFLNTKIADEKGELTDTWKSFFGQLLDQIQERLSNEGGYQIPQLTQDELDQKTNVPDGTHFYNTTTNKAVVKVNGTFQNYG